MRGPVYTSLVAGLPSLVPFVGPEAQERARGGAFTARLGANESGYGPSPRAIAAMADAAGSAWMYGDPEAYDLREALAAHHGVSRANILVGEGIDGILGYLVRLLIAPGDAVVTSDGAYPTFNFHVTGYGGVLHKVPYSGNHEDPQALIAEAARSGAKLIYIANPDNPMGSWHEAATMQTMIEAVPEGALLVLDEAYIELAPEGTAPPIDVTDPRVIRMRTFSKGQGMAGARVGYAIAHEDLIRAFDKVRNHFGMSRISLAGALAALQDETWIPHVRARVAAAKEEISAIARANGLEPLPSATNFLTIDCGGTGDLARALVRELGAEGIFIRMPFVAPHDRCIRISCGLPEDHAALAAVLPKALARARAAV